MYIDPEKLEGEQMRGVLASAMDDLEGLVASVKYALAEGHRGSTASSLEGLFDEFEALRRICAERLT